MTKQRVYSRYAKEAALLLGKHIKLGRKQRKWSEQILSERAGISRRTLQKIEKGDMTPAIGLYFEVAVLVGVNLFETDKVPPGVQIERIQDKISLLPKRIKAPNRAVDDDF